MERNDLKLNPDKTDVLLIHSRFREGPALDYLQFRDERISISEKARSLGVILDKHLINQIDDQIDHVCKTSINHLRSLFRIRRYLDVNSASTVIHALITKRLDYCNHLHFGLPKYKVKKLQQIQNIAARYVSPVYGNMIISFLSYSTTSLVAGLVSDRVKHEIFWNIGNQLGLFARIFKTC